MIDTTSVQRKKIRQNAVDSPRKRIPASTVHGTYSTPYGITRTYCNTIFTADRLEEHKHADGNTGEKGEEPQKSRLPVVVDIFSRLRQRASNNPPTIRNIQFVIVVMMIICKYTSTVPAPNAFCNF